MSERDTAIAASMNALIEAARLFRRVLEEKGVAEMLDGRDYQDIRQWLHLVCGDN